MAAKFAQGLVLLIVIASMFAVGMSNKDWYFGVNYTDWWSHFGHHKPNKTRFESKKIIVGGSENWRFGFNYTDWAIKSGPFYLNDTLVFKYDAPNDTTHPHSVYLFSNFQSFLKCDLKRAKRVATPTQGVGNGFKFVLKTWRPYYFACGERNGSHCSAGLMKFVVMPMLRPFWPWP
ncbi:hypothetical protein L6164_035648 [Bauhinia variegata]|uniref:Uncharacterized protein n=1 Tax=Bauhinia variegata TaxID=167791 RepID=A0ACB9KEK4_BAUVA|nr:hypothetical protein L6164_035648 [Bauhinia variegata]